MVSVKFWHPPARLKSFNWTDALRMQYTSAMREHSHAVQHACVRTLRESCVPPTLCMTLQLCETGHIISIIMRSRISPPGFVPGDKFIYEVSICTLRDVARRLLGGTIGCLADLRMHVKSCNTHPRQFDFQIAESPTPRHDNIESLQRPLTIEAAPFE